MRLRPHQAALAVCLMLGSAIAVGSVGMRTHVRSRSAPRTRILRGRTLNPRTLSYRAFPFDTQTCNFTVGSNAYVGSILDVRPRLVDRSSYTLADDALLEDPVQRANLSLLADRSAVDLTNFWPSEEFALTKVCASEWIDGGMKGRE